MRAVDYLPSGVLVSLTKDGSIFGDVIGAGEAKKIDCFSIKKNVNDYHHFVENPLILRFAYVLLFH